MSYSIKGTVAGAQSVKGKLKEILSLDNTLTKEGYAADAKAVGDELKTKAPISHTEDRDNPHNVTAAQVGARPNTWTPTAEEVGAATIADVQKIARANLLDNWYFANPVNQRGKSEYVGAGYTIDRWKIEGTSKASLKVVDGGVQFINQGGTNELCRQYAEGGLAGKQVTFSILVTELTGEAFFAVQSQPLHVGLNTQTFSVGESGVPTTYFWIPHHGGSITVAAAKLELGDTQTLAHEENGVWVLNEIPNYAEELARCKRYLQVYRPQTLSGQTVHSPIGIGVADSENRLEIDIPLSVPLRNGVLPSVLYSGDICAWDGQTERTATDFRVIGVSDADLRVVCSTSGATARGIYTLAVLKSNMDGYFMINAEL